MRAGTARWRRGSFGRRGDRRGGEIGKGLSSGREGRGREGGGGRGTGGRDGRGRREDRRGTGRRIVDGRRRRRTIGGIRTGR